MDSHLETALTLRSTGLPNKFRMRDSVFMFRTCWVRQKSLSKWKLKKTRRGIAPTSCPNVMGLYRQTKRLGGAGGPFSHVQDFSDLP